MATSNTPSVKARIAAIAGIPGEELYQKVQAKSSTYEGHTAEGTSQFMTLKGFAPLANDKTSVESMYNLTMRTLLQMVYITKARDPLSDSGFGAGFGQPWAGNVQRMNVWPMKPITPGYTDVQNGQSKDPFINNKGKITEQIFEQNFNYQATLTTQEINLRQVLSSEFGYSQLMAGLMSALASGWVIQKYENKLATLNAYLNDDNMKPTQVIQTKFAGTWDNETLLDFIQNVLDVITSMTIHPQQSSFNMLGFPDVQDTGRLKLLIRPGYKNALRVRTLLGAFNPDEINLGVDVIEVPNFGGLTYELSDGTPLYPAYGALGDVIGLNETKDANTATHQIGDENVVTVDPNEDVVAILADKDLIFESTQNEYTVQAIYNPRQMTTHLWANAPNNMIKYDRTYNAVVFKKQSTT